MGGSSSSSSSSKKETQTTTVTDQSEGAVISTSEQGGAARFSNIVDSDVRFEVRNQGLSGEDFAKALEPAGAQLGNVTESLESISKDITATRGAVQSIYATGTGVADDAKEAVENFTNQAKAIATNPYAQLVAGGIVLYMLREKTRKGARA